MSYTHRHFLMSEHGVTAFETYAEVLRATRQMPAPWVSVDRAGHLQAEAKSFDWFDRKEAGDA